MNNAKKFDILALSLSLHNYFYNLLNYFQHLHLAKFLDTLAKPFFPCINQ